MSLIRIGHVIRTRWRFSLVFAAVVLALGGLVVWSQTDRASSSSTVVSQMRISGPVHENEQYAFDTNSVALEIAGSTSAYLSSDAVLREVRDSMAATATLTALRSGTQVQLIAGTPIVEMSVTMSDAAVATQAMIELKRIALDMVEQMGGKRFSGPSPLDVTVLLDAVQTDREDEGGLARWAVLLVVAAVAGAAAGVLRHFLARRISDPADVADILDRLGLDDGIVVGSSDPSQVRRARAAVDRAAPALVVVAPADRTTGSRRPAEQLRDSLVAGGSTATLVLAGIAGAEAPADAVTVGAVTEILPGGSSRVVVLDVPLDDADQQLSRGALTRLAEQFGAAGETLVLAVAGPQHSTTVAALPLSSAVAIHVVTPRATRRAQLVDQLTAASGGSLRHDPVVWCRSKGE